MTRKFLILSLLLLPILSFAHGGEDHGEGAKPAEVTSAAPRAEAQTDLFELVATPHNGLLTVYVDRFANNQPVSDAKVEIESGTWNAVANAVEGGAYQVAAPQFAVPGTYPLVFTVTAGDDADLLETTLVIGEPASATARGNLPSRSVWGWLSAALIAMTVAAVGILKRRKSARLGK
jgi:hypothetical protein